jgi:hypothetical protein
VKVALKMLREKRSELQTIILDARGDLLKVTTAIRALTTTSSEPLVEVAEGPKKRRRRKMTDAEKKAVSVWMKASWAKRKRLATSAVTKAKEVKKRSGGRGKKRKPLTFKQKRVLSRKMKAVWAKRRVGK